MSEAYDLDHKLDPVDGNDPFAYVKMTEAEDVVHSNLLRERLREYRRHEVYEYLHCPFSEWESYPRYVQKEFIEEIILLKQEKKAAADELENHLKSGKS